MQDDTFEWDDAKAQSNLRKHGISFEAARLVFRDAFAIEPADDQDCYQEDRTIIIGMAKGQLLVVVYTERGERIRMISARRAEKRECDGYYKNQAIE